MESSFVKKPAARMVKGRPSLPVTAEEAADEKDALEVMQANQAKEKAREDKIAGVFDGKWYVTNWTHPVLVHPHLPQLSVSRFYPEDFVAIDIFPFMTDYDKNLIEFKRKAFKENEVTHGGKQGKVRYAALTYSDNLSVLGPQLEA